NSTVMTVPYDGYDKPHNDGNWGLFLKYRPEWLWGGTAGFYYRRADETLPWVLLHQVYAIQPTDKVCNTAINSPFAVCAVITGSEAFEGYQAVYNRGVSLMGFSYEKNWHRMTFGAEFVMRSGTALQTLLAP